MTFRDSDKNKLSKFKIPIYETYAVFKASNISIRISLITILNKKSFLFDY
jgi:hypothetical protein